MTDSDRVKYLRIVLVVVGAIFNRGHLPAHYHLAFRMSFEHDCAIYATTR